MLGVSTATEKRGENGQVKLSRKIWKAWAVFGDAHIGKRSWTQGEEGHAGSET